MSRQLLFVKTLCVVEGGYSKEDMSWSHQKRATTGDPVRAKGLC